MNTIRAMLAVAIQHQSAEEVAQQMHDLWIEREDMRKERDAMRDEWHGKHADLCAEVYAHEPDATQTAKAGNRVLTLDEVRSLPKGAEVWGERRDGRGSGYRNLEIGCGVHTLHSKSIGVDWCLCYKCSSYYNNWFRAWTNGEPTATESAATPWAGDGK